MKRPSSSRNRFEVFDFCKEDERVESLSEKIMSKLGNPKKSHNSPLSKHRFLEFFTTKGTKTGPKKVSHEPIDVDDSSPDHQSTKSVSNVLGTSPERGAHLSGHESGNHFSEPNTFSARCLNLGVSSAGSKCLDFTLTQSLSNDEPIGVISDDESITSSCSSDLRVNEVSPEEPAREGNEMLKFSVFDPHWCEGQEAIKSLDLRDNAIWNAKFNFDELVGDIIYPKGDPDAVSISKRDVELLQPERFINDTIIDFYIKYLKNKIRPEEKHRFHFFNSFFFRKLADLDKDPSSVCEGIAAFQRVRKWTRKVNLFEKDYIFIPVNFSLHWSLIVICHPCEVANFKDEEIDKSPRVPCILHMDSKKGSHRGLKNLIQSYLLEEWRDRQSEIPEDVSSRFLNLRFVPLELPQQENSFDCGLFLLHYVELFLTETPVNFNPFQIAKCSNFLNRCWFPPAEASLKRVYIQKLIFQFVGNISPADCNDKCPSSQIGDSDERETVIENFDDFSSSSKTCNGIPSIVQDEQRIEISVVPASPPTGVKCIGKPGLSSREFIEQGATAGSFPHELHRKRIMSPIEEVEEVEEQVSNTPSSKAGCHTVDVIVVEPSETSHFTKSSKVLQTSSKTRIYMHLEEHEDGDSSSGSSICGSQNSMGVDQYYCPEEIVRETDEQESASISCEDFAGCVVEDSQEADEMHDGNASKGFLASCQINVVDLCHEDDASCVNIDLKPKNIPLGGNDLVTKAKEQLAAKKANAYSFQRNGDNSRGACLIT